MAGQIATIKQLLLKQHGSVESLCLLRLRHPYAYTSTWDYFIALKGPTGYRLCKVVMHNSLLLPCWSTVVEYRSSEVSTAAADLFTSLQDDRCMEALLAIPSSPWYAGGGSHLLIETPSINKHWVWKEGRGHRILTREILAVLSDLQIEVSKATGTSLL
jgi:hypothetical protein